MVSSIKSGLFFMLLIMILVVIGAGLYLSNKDQIVKTIETIVPSSHLNAQPIYADSLVYDNVILTDFTTINAGTNTCEANNLNMKVNVWPCTAQDIDGKEIKQYVNFTWSGSSQRNISWVFVYDGQLEDGRIELIKFNQPYTYTVSERRDDWVNNYLVSGVVNYTNLGLPDFRCQIGNTNNTQMYYVNQNNASGPSSRYYCFTNVSIINSTAFRISGNRNIFLDVEKQGYQDLKVKIPVNYLGKGLLNDGERTYYKIDNVGFNPGQSYYTEWTFTPKNNAKDGKWHILGYEDEYGLINSITDNRYIYLDPWWSGSGTWTRKQAINLTGGNITLTDFTVMLNITYDSDMQADFDDLRFLDSTETTELKCELDTKVNSVYARVYCRIPTLNPGEKNNTIYMYYGNDSAASSWNHEAAWAYDVGVWHFSEGTGNTAKSVNSLDNATSSSTGTWVNGPIGYAINLSGSGGYWTVNDKSYFTANMTTGNTWLIWVLGRSTAAFNDIWTKDAAASREWAILEQTTYKFSVYNPNSDFSAYTFVKSNDNTINGSFNFFGWSWNGSCTDASNHLYKNGGTDLALTSASSGCFSTLTDSSSAMLFGYNTAFTRGMQGAVDEAYMFNKTLNPSEVQRYYENANYSKFTFNTEEANITPVNSTISVSLFSPANNTFSSQSVIIFNWTVNPTGGNITNSTVYLWYSNGTLINSSFTQGVNRTACIQEHANVSTACGGFNTGSYSNNSDDPLLEWNSLKNASDGDWSTYARGMLGINGFLNYIVNYTVPLNSTGAILQIKIDTPTQNITIPQDCFNYSSNLSIKVSLLYASPNAYERVYCYSGGWQQLYTSGISAPYYFYEEQMLWLNNRTNTSADYSVSLSGIPEGNLTWNAEGCINQNTGGSNCTRASSNYTLTTDFTNPLISISYPTATNYTVSSLNLNYTVSDINLQSCWYFNGTANVSVSCGTNATISPRQGSNTWIVYANDSANNVNSSSVTFNVDSLVPEINFTATTTANNSSSPLSNIYVEVYGNDTNINYINATLTNSSGYPLQIVTMTNVSKVYSYNFTSLTDGTYRFNATAYDTYGNINSTVTRTINLDTTAPNITIFSPSGSLASGYTGINLTLNATASDSSLRTCWFIYNGVTNYTVSCNVNYTFTPLIGVNSLQYYANDSAGNTRNVNTTWAYSLFLGNLNASGSVYETAKQNLSYTIYYDTALYSSYAANLYYNGTVYSADSSGSAGTITFSKYIDNPLFSSGSTKNLFWSINLYNVTGVYQTNTSSLNQTITPIYFNFCNSSINVSYLNISFKNETLATETISASISGTFYYSIGGGVNKTYTFQNLTENREYNFCFIPSNTTINAASSIVYYNSESTQRTYINNSMFLSNTTTNLTLYLLPTSYGSDTYFKIVSSGLIGIPNALVSVYNPGGALVESRTTDSTGTAAFFLDPLITYQVCAEASGYTSTCVNIAPVASTTYQIQLSSSTSSAVDYLRDIRVSISPSGATLYNGTTYNFTMVISSDYYNLDSFGFVLKDQDDVYLASATGLNPSGDTIVASVNIGDAEYITMDYYWIVDGDYSNLTRKWSVISQDGTDYSISNFISNFKSYTNNTNDTDGLFGLKSGGSDNFSMVILSFVVILLGTGVATYRYGISSPGVVMAIMTSFVYFFDIVIDLIPGNSITIIVAFITAILIIREELA